MNHFVIYHGGCYDGFCSAWLWNKIYPNSEYYSGIYQTKPPDVSGRDVVLLDFSYKRPILEELNKTANSLLVLDHHKTAQQDLEGLNYCQFDMDRSGARMTFDYLNMADDYNDDLINYIQDRDLWTWKLPYSKEINACIQSYSLTFEDFDILNDRFNNFEQMRAEGAAILRNNKKIVEEHFDKSQEIVFDGHKVLEVNATVLMSEIGGRLAKNRPFGMTYFINKNGEKIYSLRSTNEGVDVSEIAKKYGGGGHRNAAGFKLI